MLVQGYKPPSWHPIRVAKTGRPRRDSGTGGVLKAAQVAEIRSLYAEQNWTIATLARQFDVSERTISMILRGETWK